MCDEGKDRFLALRIFLAKKGAAGQINLRSTATVRRLLHMHWTNITIPRAPHNFTLTFINFIFSHSLPNSLTSLHNFSSELSTSAVLLQL